MKEEKKNLILEEQKQSYFLCKKYRYTASISVVLKVHPGKQIKKKKCLKRLFRAGNNDKKKKKG